VAAKIGEMRGFAVESEGEIFFWAATQAGLALAIVGGDEKKEQARQES
jgi:hypothetical protein